MSNSSGRVTASLLLVLSLLAGLRSAARAQSGLSIRTDASRYTVGEAIQVCYSVPGPGAVTIIDLPSDGTQTILWSANDDGVGQCLDATVTPPTGTECLRIDFVSSTLSASASTCFQVVGMAQAPLPPPSNFRISANVPDQLTVAWDPEPGGVSVGLYAPLPCTVVDQPPPMPEATSPPSVTVGTVRAATASEATASGCYLFPTQDATTNTFYGLTPGMRYCFIAYAASGAGYSDWSSWVCAVDGSAG